MNSLFPGSGDLSLVDQYQVSLPKNGTLTINMGSVAVDSFLLLFSSLQQNPIAVDDDGGVLSNARISIHLPAGTYIVLANTATATATTGAYALALSFAPDIWSATSTDSAPDGRRLHSAVWTGLEMIVWGGDNGNAIAMNTGGRFNPVTNTWTPTTTLGAPSARSSHTAVWTGTEMIVWGGFSGAFAFQTLGDGGRYNPQTDTWSPITAINAPSARFNHTAIWTGTEMIVWGGSSCTACDDAEVDTGARYNPVTDTWFPTSATLAPSPRGKHSAVWTGSKMIVWGGRNEGSPVTATGPSLLDTGGIYDPISDTWTSTGQIGVPTPRSVHAAVWTGSLMIVFGGETSTASAGSDGTGGLYNPASNSWTSTNTAGAPIFSPPGAPAVWTDDELITWAGAGGRFNPSVNSWSGISGLGAPSAGPNNTAVWTGSAMIVWSGGIGVPPPNTGGIYDPSVDQTP